MLRSLSTLTVFLALLVGVLACTSIPETADDIPRITPEELKAELDKGSVTVIDVRGATFYEASHVPGALNIPELEIKSRVAELLRDRLIVTYCT
ncbi:MAG: rhodanese-like domain-containing protein [Dehalococcoidales bacterium]